MNITQRLDKKTVLQVAPFIIFEIFYRKDTMLRAILLSLIFFFLFIFSGANTSTANDQEIARFKELTVVLSTNDLLLFAGLENSITKEMVEVLKSGLPLDFTFKMELYRPTAGASEQIHVKEFSHTISYDTLTDEYKIEYSENGRSETYPDLESATAALDTINGLQVIPLSRLIPNNTYNLKLKADLFHKTLPPGLAPIIPFITWDDRKTDWQEVNFKY